MGQSSDELAPGWPETAGYVDVSGRRTWHHVIGDHGDPVALLHGAFAGASSWSAQTPALAAAGRRVHLPERRGHAHTPDVPGPLSYAVMATDACAYIEQIVGGAADVIGWSDGAIVGLLTALERPDLVRRLVLIGQYYNSAGRSHVGEELEHLLTLPEVVTFLRSEYDEVSPDGPEHFEIVHAKVMTMVQAEPEIDLEQLGRVTCPTLVMQGDHDIATVDHAAAVVDALPNARLSILPGTNLLPTETPDVVNRVVIAFLNDELPGRTIAP